jgi:hypothetical protein
VQVAYILHDELDDPGLQDRAFSLAAGGPLFEALRRLKLVDESMLLVWRRVALFLAFTWAPLVAMTAFNSALLPDSASMSFVEDIETQVRFLVAGPLLLLAEPVVHQRLRPILHQFTRRNLVSPHEAPRFQAAMDRALRMRNSWIAEFALLLLVIGGNLAIGLGRFSDLGAESWLYGPGAAFSPAGHWFLFVSLPLFQFLLLRWYFRLLVWTILLWRICRLDLELYAIHPDRCGGLAFLGTSLAAFAPLGAAHGALFGGFVAARIVHAGAAVGDFRFELLAALALLILVFTAPLLLFSPKLAHIKRSQLRTYGGLGQTYARDFHDKWVQSPQQPEEPLLGSGDIQSLNDLAGSFSIANEMRIVPVTRTGFLIFVASAAAPILPLMLTVMPADKLLEALAQVLL